MTFRKPTKEEIRAEIEAGPWYMVVEIDGDRYVVDESTMITSKPPQYNCYRLSDGKRKFIFCHEAIASHLDHMPRAEWMKVISSKHSYTVGATNE